MMFFRFLENVSDAPTAPSYQGVNSEHENTAKSSYKLLENPFSQVEVLQPLGFQNEGDENHGRFCSIGQRVGISGFFRLTSILQ